MSNYGPSIWLIFGKLYQIINIKQNVWFQGGMDPEKFKFRMACLIVVFIDQYASHLEKCTKKVGSAAHSKIKMTLFRQTIMDFTFATP